MKRSLLLSTATLSILLASSLIPVSAAQPMCLLATISLEGVRGRIDHFGADIQGRRLFMSALGNDTVEVFDIRANRRLHTIAGLREPQGTAYAPKVNKLYVANADDGTVDVFDGTTYKLLGELHFSSDADDMRYDATTGRIYVGYGDGAVAAIDLTDDKVLGEIAVPAHPEAYEVAKGGGKIFINVPDAREIAVADWNSRQVLAHWPLGSYQANFPMALDAGDRRLFVVTREPAQLLVLDTASGRILAHLPAVGDADDVWYDAHLRRIYITGGEGYISVVAQRDADHYQSIENIPTAPGARTSFFLPELGRLYVAAPGVGSKAAELRVYATMP